MDDNGKIVWVFLGAAGALLLVLWLCRRQLSRMVRPPAGMPDDGGGQIIPFPSPTSNQGGCA